MTAPACHVHGAAARDAAHDVEAVGRGLLGVDLVAERLEAADDDGRLLPLPDAQRGVPATGADLLGEHLVERHLLDGPVGAVVDDLPLVVAPVRGARERAADRDGDGLGREAEEHGLRRESAADGGGDRVGVAVLREAVHRAVDGLERVVRLEEEVARQAEAGDAPVGHVQVDHDELAAWDLVLTMHPPSLGRGTGRARIPDHHRLGDVGRWSVRIIWAAIRLLTALTVLVAVASQYVVSSSYWRSIGVEGI